MVSTNIILDLERGQIDAITATAACARVRPGDTVKVMVKVIEGRLYVRTQAYEGVVIGRSGAGMNENFTVRKISYGEGVERVFPVYSPYIAEIEVLRRGKVRRAKLYYLRGRRGKSARIFERTDARAKRLNAAFKGFKKPKGEPDDLTKIKGVDAELAGRLNGTRRHQVRADRQLLRRRHRQRRRDAAARRPHREGRLGRARRSSSSPRPLPPRCRPKSRKARARRTVRRTRRPTKPRKADFLRPSHKALGCRPTEFDFIGPLGNPPLLRGPSPRLLRRHPKFHN